MSSRWRTQAVKISDPTGLDLKTRNKSDSHKQTNQYKNPAMQSLGGDPINVLSSILLNQKLYINWNSVEVQL